MSEAILFPGQGAQSPGMGQDWAEAFPTARAVFEQADAILGFSLTDAIWNQGDKVHRTDIAQPGILTTSVAILSVLREQGLDTDSAAMTAGLSLGEYTALWVSGALEFESARRLVRLRGEAMQDASDQIKSSMTSLTGATPEQAEALVAIGKEQGICSVANLNAPGQVVVSGELAALEAVEAAADDREAWPGIRRTVRLTVAGGFHSECMRPASDRLAAALVETRIQAPAIPFVTNVTGEPVEDPEEIRGHLARQVCAPVLWDKSMRWALGQGISEYLEPGPGKVLAGLMRRIAKDAGASACVRPAEHPEDLG